MFHSLVSRPMKIFDSTLYACIISVLVSFLVSCGGDHADGNHSGSGLNDDSHAPKSQENLLTMLEETNSPSGETRVHAPIASKDETAESLGHAASSSANDLEALLGGDPPVTGEPANGAASIEPLQLKPKTSATYSVPAKDIWTSPGRDLEDLLSKFNNSKIAFEEQIKTLNSLVEQRDNTIRSLMLINQKLRDELKSLRKTNPSTTANLPINGEIQVLRDELLKLKNTFTLKVKELDELRIYNKELLGRLDNLDPSAKRASGRLLSSDVVPTNESANVADADGTLKRVLPDLPVVDPRHNAENLLTVRQSKLALTWKH